MAEISISRKIIRNTQFNTIGRVWEVLVRIFLTPYIISRIGGERYGIWAIVTVVTGYFSIIDLGVGDSFLKYFAEYITKGDSKNTNLVANTGFVFYFIIGVVILAIAMPLIHCLLGFFKIEGTMYGEALFALKLGFLVLVFSSIFGVFSFIPLGLQRMEVSNGISVCLSIPYIIGTILFLEMGFGLRGLMINNAINAVIMVIANLAVAFKLYNKLIFNPIKYFSKQIMAKLIKFGYKMKAIHIARLVNRNLDKLLIGHFMAMGFVTYYHLGATIVDKAQILPYVLVSALLPAFAEIYFRLGKDKLTEGYRRGTKYLAFLVMPFFIFLIIGARSILLLWMGPGFERSVLVLRLLAFGWMIYNLSWISRPVLKTLERHFYQMIADIIIVVLNISLSIIFILLFGFYGVVVGTMISLIIGGAIIIIIFHKLMRISIHEFWKATFSISAAAIFSGLLIYLIDFFLKNFVTMQNRFAALALLLIEGSVFIFTYIMLLRVLRPFDAIDRDIIGKNIVIVKPIIAFLAKARS